MADYNFWKYDNIVVAKHCSLNFCYKLKFFSFYKIAKLL